MKKSAKILTTIILVVIFLIIFAIILFIRQSNGYRSAGMLGVILGFGLLAALGAVWKKSNNDNEHFPQ